MTEQPNTSHLCMYVLMSICLGSSIRLQLEKGQQVLAESIE